MRTPLTLLAAAAILSLVACGKPDAPAPAAAPAPAPTTEAAPAGAPAAPAAEMASNEAGKAAYGKACALCHATGVAGAPKVGDKADWDIRAAQGEALLFKHAIEGFTGSKGAMPARGGSSLNDDDVKAAVRYMVEASR